MLSNSLVFCKRNYEGEHVEIAVGELMATERGSGKYFHASEAP